MTNDVELIATGRVADLVALLFDEERGTAIVAITTRRGRPLVDPDRLAAAIGSEARVVLLDADAADALSDELPEKLGVFGGACRIWWTGLTRAADPYDHPLIWVTPRQGERADMESRLSRGMADLRHRRGWWSSMRQGLSARHGAAERATDDQADMRGLVPQDLGASRRPPSEIGRGPRGAAHSPLADVRCATAAGHDAPTTSAVLPGAWVSP